ncbi:unnamed protein product [Nippostrongylus brasiliensis]|uniref:Pept_C1 domain-containing protein n=1 Tax=Nippostrongylus brasiliensis TaxID=27835 RepID=A0A0N4Y268_NIPBR|nr:unnamed protein product [Nippostrongylus brasiliensis]
MRVHNKQFLAQPIKEDARRLTGQALVNFVNQRQPFFKVSLNINTPGRLFFCLILRFLHAVEMIAAWGAKEEIHSKHGTSFKGAVSAVVDNCKPYPFHPCGRHPNQTYYGECPKDHLYRTPACKPYCQYSYHKRLDQDKVYGTSSYNVKFDEETIQREIMKNGPVHASFTVYEDFHFYESGIYVHTAGKETGGHAVKIIGWGVENGTKFWLISNSWGTDWGEDGGYYRMVRGVNNCGLEEDIVAGLLG